MNKSRKFRWARNAAVFGIASGCLSVLDYEKSFLFIVAFAYVGYLAIVGAFVGLLAATVFDLVQPEVYKPEQTSQAGAAIRLNFLLRHWRGEYPLWIAYWVIALGGTIGFLTVL